MVQRLQFDHENISETFSAQSSYSAEHHPRYVGNVRRAILRLYTWSCITRVYNKNIQVGSHDDTMARFPALSFAKQLNRLLYVHIFTFIFLFFLKFYCQQIKKFIPEQFSVEAHPALFVGGGGGGVSPKMWHCYSSLQCWHTLSKRAQNTQKNLIIFITIICTPSSFHHCSSNRIFSTAPSHT